MEKVMVALITPFTAADTIDYLALGLLIERLLREGADGFIVCGTTGEAPLLSLEEKLSLLSYVIERVRGRCEIWMGCGSNSTAETCRMCRLFSAYEISGYLLVAPYYNRPSQKGLYLHYCAAAAVSDKPIMLYNVPSRSAVSLEYETIRSLIQNVSTIKALKQASSDLDSVKKLKKEFADFTIYSGEDGALDEGMDAGMDGIISVSAHVNLVLMKRFLQEKRKDNLLRKRLKKEAKLLFQEPSPSCIKYVLSQKGECENILRLPLCPISKAMEAALDAYDGF